MDAYLLDTNLVSALYDSRRPDYQQVVSTVASLDPDAPQLVSAVTIAELRFGLALYAATGNPLTHIEACIRQAEEHPLAEVEINTIIQSCRRARQQMLETQTMERPGTLH